MSILFNFLISPRQFIFKGSFQDLDMLTKPETNFFKFISCAIHFIWTLNPVLSGHLTERIPFWPFGGEEVSS
jgi:hypothetical protein